MDIKSFPIVAVGGVLFKDCNVLLVKRGKDPAKGLWAIPGGKIKPGEEIKKALKREFIEETGIYIKVGEVVYVFDAIDIPDYHYVIIDYVVEMMGGKLRAGDDADEVRWFNREELDDYLVAPATMALLSRFTSFCYTENSKMQ